MWIGNPTEPSVGEIGIIWDHTLLIHSHEHQNLANHFELIAIGRN